MKVKAKTYKPATLRFGGKPFTRIAYHTKKSACEAIAKQQRDIGGQARVVDIGRNVFGVYARGRKRIPDAITRNGVRYYKVFQSEQKARIEARKRSWKREKPYMKHRTVRFGKKLVLFVGAK